jgi:iron complex transport system substrate-binding protein
MSKPIANALAFAAACWLGLAGQACGAEERRITDDAGRQVAVPAQVKRVYAAGPPASIFVYAVAPDKLIGWTRSMRPDEAAFLPQRYAELPELGRLTGRGNTANVEIVLGAKPDLVFDAGSLAPTFASLADRVQEQTGIAYVLLDGSFAETAHTFRVLGSLLGEEVRGRALGDYVDATLADIRKRIAAVPADKRPRVYYGRTPSGLQTALSGSINVEVLDVVGVVNVAGTASKAMGGLANASLEQVLAWDPDVIVTTDPNFFELVRTHPVWASLAAVKKKRVYLSPHLPFGWFDFPPGPNRLIGLQWLAKILYPDLFKEDLRPKIAEFYRLFYHREPTPAQLDALMAEATPR